MGPPLYPHYAERKKIQILIFSCLYPHFSQKLSLLYQPLAFKFIAASYDVLLSVASGLVLLAKLGHHPQRSLFDALISLLSNCTSKALQLMDLLVKLKKKGYF